MAPVLCFVPLRGADPTYHITADCTTAAFSRLVCSVQAMEVNYGLHEPNLTTTKQQHEHLLIQMGSSQAQKMISASCGQSPSSGTADPGYAPERNR